MSSALDSYASYEWTDVQTTAGLSFLFGLVTLIIFECIRTKEIYKHIYQARSKIKRQQRHPVLDRNSKLSLLSVINTSGSEILEYAGLDAYMFIRYLRLCFRSCMFAMFWGLLILIPVYATGQSSETGFYTLTLVNVEQGSSRLWVVPPFAYLFMLHLMYLLKKEFQTFADLRNQFLTEGDPDLEPQTMFTVMVERIPPEFRSNTRLYNFFDGLFQGKVHSAQICLYLQELDHMVAVRHNLVRKMESAMLLRAAQKLSPKRLRQLEEDEEFLAELNMMIDNQQRAFREVQTKADQGMDAQELEQLARDEGLEEVTRPADDMDDDPFVRTVRLMSQESTNGTEGCFGKFKECCSQCCGQCWRGSTQIGTHLGEETALGASLLARGVVSGATKLANVLGKLTLGQHVTSTGFVTFTNLSAKATVSQILLTPHPMRFQARSAPEPRDIIWKNVTSPQSQVELRQNVTNMILVFGIVVWSAVVTFIQAISSMQTLEKYVTFLGELESNNKYLYSLISGYLPVVMLLIVVQLLPYIFQALEQRYVGLKSYSAIQATVLIYFFYYQVANVYVSVMSGSIWTSLTQLVENPGSVLVILADAIPTVSVYFLDVIIVKIFVGLPMELIRPWPLVQMTFIFGCTNVKKITVKEAEEGVFEAPFLKYGWYYPNQLFVIMIILIYAIISPILLPAGVLYFGFSIIIYKYQVLACYVPKYEGGGSSWFRVYNHTMIALVAAQVTLITYMVIKEASWQTIFVMIPLPFSTLWYGTNVGSNWSNSSEKLSLQEAIKLDKANHRFLSLRQAEQKGEEMRERAFSQTFNVEAYLQPSLRVGAVVPNPQRAFSNASGASHSSSLGELPDETKDYGSSLSELADETKDYGSYQQMT